MKYLPQTPEQINDILSRLNLKSTADLFRSLPDSVKKDTGAGLDEPLSEIEVRRHFAGLKQKNRASGLTRNFCGGGSYSHYIPSIIDPLVTRGEFLTAYTSYQPEVSQGTLQAIYEYQSMLCDLTGMDICNASLYDGATSVIEAMYMSSRVSRKKTAIIAGSLTPSYLETVKTYNDSKILRILTWRQFDENSRLVLTEKALQTQFDDWQKEGLLNENESLEDLVSSLSSFVVQSPNYYGLVEDYNALKGLFEKAHIIHVITEATSLGILKSPRELGADITCGEAQAFGIPVNMGGPHLGFLGATAAFMRQVPGRLVGEGLDSDGERVFLITLATREQHIRREKATSNICTNQGLMVIRAAVYLAAIGRQGLKDTAQLCHNNTLYLLDKLQSVKSIKLPLRGAVYNEFVIEFADQAARDRFFSLALEHDIVPGIRIAENRLLCAITEMLTTADLDEYAALAGQV